MGSIVTAIISEYIGWHHHHALAYVYFKAQSLRMRRKPSEYFFQAQTFHSKKITSILSMYTSWVNFVPRSHKPDLQTNYTILPRKSKENYEKTPWLKLGNISTLFLILLLLVFFFWAYCRKKERSKKKSKEKLNNWVGSGERKENKCSISNPTQHFTDLKPQNQEIGDRYILINTLLCEQKGYSESSNLVRLIIVLFILLKPPNW